MHSVIIIGAGVMGSRLTRHFLSAGFNVALVDPVTETLTKAAHFLSCCGSGAERLTLTEKLANLGPDWSNPAVTIEAVPEQLTLKRAVIAELEAFLAPDSLIASNTSGLTTAALTKDMRHPERFVIAHFFNPADLIPVVELIANEAMPPDRLETLAELLRVSGKIPAVLKKEVPGFVANRIQHAMMRECFHLLAEGVADAATIDDIIRYSIGVRMALAGPFEQRDLNGLDTHLAISNYLYADLASDTEAPALLRTKVEAGELGRKAGRGFYIWDAARSEGAAKTEAALADLIGRCRELDAGTLEEN